LSEFLDEGEVSVWLFPAFCSGSCLDFAEQIAFNHFKAALNVIETCP